MATGIRKPGEFCWINMLTPRPDNARTFFGALLDWRYSEMPGMGHLVQVDGHDIGGLFDLNGPNTLRLAPFIGVMVKVANADATSQKAKALGGQAKPAFDISDQGRMALCFDPNGAEFDIWEPKKMLGTDLDPSIHGAPCWFETLTTDVDRATQFYSELFGWTSTVTQVSGFSYTTFKNDGIDVAGLMQIMPEMGEIPPHWGTYFTVNDVNQTARQAVELGALFVPPQDIPGIGRYCGIKSPQGVMFYGFARAVKPVFFDDR